MEEQVYEQARELLGTGLRGFASLQPNAAYLIASR
jgi:hypothetical protein